MESIAPGPKSSDHSSQPAAAPSHKTRKAPKNTRKAPKNAGKPSQDTRKPPKRSKPRKNATTAQKDAGRDAHDVLLAEKEAGDASQDKPKVKRVRLVAPSRTGRTVTDLQLVLTRAEVRLELAWRHRATLNVALPKAPPFHDHAWSAMAALRGEPGEGEEVTSDGSGGAALALDALLGSLRQHCATWWSSPRGPATRRARRCASGRRCARRARWWSSRRR